MRGDTERDRATSKITSVALTLFGLYLILIPILAPSAGWNGLVERFGETRILTLLVGFLFLYFAAISRENHRLRLVTGEILEGLNRAIHGAGSQSNREAVGVLIEALKSPNERVRSLSLRQLRRVTGADPGDDYESWREWWRENRDAVGSEPGPPGDAQSMKAKESTE
jgi:hypothetical protein